MTNFGVKKANWRSFRARGGGYRKKTSIYEMQVQGGEKMFFRLTVHVQVKDVATHFFLAGNHFFSCCFCYLFFLTHHLPNLSPFFCLSGILICSRKEIKISESVLT